MYSASAQTWPAASYLVQSLLPVMVWPESRRSRRACARCGRPPASPACSRPGYPVLMMMNRLRSAWSATSWALTSARKVTVAPW
jgi:hypothetical protein